jgi:hypothetical protein
MLKKVLDWQLPILVTRREKRSKNFLKLADFGVRVDTVLIEMWIAGSVRRLADRKRKAKYNT